MVVEMVISCCCGCEVGEVSELEFDFAFQVCCPFGLREVALLGMAGRKAGENSET